MATTSQIKELIAAMEDSVAEAAKTLGITSNPRKAVRMQIGQFMMYLSASDGEIKWKEASLISDLLGVNMSPQQLSDYIREENLYSTAFESEPPIALKILISMDNKLIDLGMGDRVPDMSSTVIETYKTVAEWIMSADDDIDANEKSDCQIYLDMLEDYANKNSKRRKQAISGFIKNTGGVSAPMKSGVSAPKKKG